MTPEYSEFVLFLDFQKAYNVGATLEKLKKLVESVYWRIEAAVPQHSHIMMLYGIFQTFLLNKPESGRTFIYK